MEYLISIACAGLAIFFYLKWQKAKDENIYL